MISYFCKEPGWSVVSPTLERPACFRSDIPRYIRKHSPWVQRRFVPSEPQEVSVLAIVCGGLHLTRFYQLYTSFFFAA